MVPRRELVTREMAVAAFEEVLKYTLKKHNISRDIFDEYSYEQQHKIIMESAQEIGLAFIDMPSKLAFLATLLEALHNKMRGDA